MTGISHDTGHLVLNMLIEDIITNRQEALTAGQRVRNETGYKRPPTNKSHCHCIIPKKLGVCLEI